MPLHWNDALATGVRQIDLQHQELIEIINELAAAHAAGRQAEALEQVLPRLSAYALFHFGSEEALMAAATPAHAARHRSQHDEFSRRVAQLRDQRAMAGELGDLVDYLQRWLVEHIMKTDCELGRFVQKRQKAGA